MGLSKRWISPFVSKKHIAALRGGFTPLHGHPASFLFSSRDAGMAGRRVREHSPQAYDHLSLALPLLAVWTLRNRDRQVGDGIVLLRCSGRSITLLTQNAFLQTQDTTSSSPGAASNSYDDHLGSYTLGERTVLSGMREQAAAATAGHSSDDEIYKVPGKAQTPSTSSPEVPSSNPSNADPSNTTFGPRNSLDSQNLKPLTLHPPPSALHPPPSSTAFDPHIPGSSQSMLGSQIGVVGRVPHDSMALLLNLQPCCVGKKQHDEGASTEDPAREAAAART